METGLSMALKGAIVGVGNAAIQGHLPGWLRRRDVSLVAAADPHSHRRRELERLVPQARWYESLRALLAGEPLDFVDICAPPAVHVELSREALEHGIHVLCEKPLACRAAELAELAAGAARARRVLYTVHNWLEAPIIRKVGELLRQGTIGEVRRCAWRTLRTKPAGSGNGPSGNWRLNPSVACGGILVDHGWHALYVVQAWVNQAPVGISARFEDRRQSGWNIEDTATLRIEFPTATADLLLSWAAEARKNQAELEGTCGRIALDDNTLTLSRADSTLPDQQWAFPMALSNGSYHPDWFDGVAERFVQAIGGGATSCQGNLHAASLCATLIDLARDSSRRNGEWLPVGCEAWVAAGQGYGTR